MKLFGLACTLALPLAMSAQTEESPLTVVEGENSYVPESNTYVYYSLTAPEDAIVTFDNLDVSDIKESGESIVSWYKTSPAKTIFWALSGKTYTFYKYGYAGEALDFTVTFTPRTYNSGTDKSNPITLEQGDNFLPCEREGGWGTPNVPVYAKFTSPRDGKLVITTDNSLSGVKRVMPDGSTVEIEFSYATGYRNVIMVDAGEEVMFEVSNAYAVVLTLSVEDSIPGSSEDEPFKTQVGENVIPAAAGTYWYSFSTPSGSDYYVMITSDDCNYPVEIIATGGYSQGSCNTMALRESFGGGVTRLIKIVKDADTETEESFNLAFQTPQPYDNSNTAAYINADEEIATPAFAGRYFYRIQAPESGNWFLDVKSVVAEGEETGTTLYVYDEGNDWSYLNGGESIHWEVENGKSYVIKATAPTNQLGAKFIATFAEVQMGQTPSYAIPVEEGINNVPVWSDVYYSYTAATNCWVVIEYNGLSVVSVYQDKDYTILSNYGENKTRFEALAGKTYTIRVDNIEEGATFSVTEQAYQQGESSTNPIDITSGETKLPEYGGKVWYRYVSEEDGFINVSTTLPYSSNSIGLYINEITSSNRIQMGYEGYYPDYTFKPIRNAISKGDVAYICVEYSDAPEGASITVTTSGANPGETIATAIPITFENNMVYTFPETRDPIWYSIELPAGVLKMTSGEYSTIYLYSEDGKTKLGQTEYEYASYGYTMKIAIEAGKYLLCDDYASGDAPYTITVSDPEPGEAPATAIQIENMGDPTEFSIDPLNRGEKRWYCIDLYEGKLSFRAEDSLGGYLYAEGDYTNELASFTFDWDSYESSFTNVEIPSDGRYYIYVTSTYSSVVYATLSGTALVHEVVGVEGIVADGAEAEYYTLSGVKVSGKLAPGMYIRVADGKATKVAVTR